jgi:hypothetical protein
MDMVPAPAGAIDWGRLVAGKTLPADQLFAAILRDRNAALVAGALAALDDETLGYFAGNPRLLEHLYTSRAPTFYAFGAALRIEHGRVRPPGGDRGVPLWELAVDARVTEPDRFIENLLGRSRGRLAYLYDAIAHLDAPHAAFVMGDWLPEAVRAERFRALAVAIQGGYSSWDVDTRPSQRVANDAAMLFAAVRVGADGAPQA